MQITCLSFKLLSIDEHARGACECTLLLEDAGIVLYGVRVFDRADGDVGVNLATGSSLAFHSRHHGDAFAALTVCAIRKFRENLEADIVKRKAECEAEIAQLVAAGNEADRALVEMPSASGRVN